jgi:hypothetical protein
MREVGSIKKLTTLVFSLKMVIAEFLHDADLPTLCIIIIRYVKNLC